MTKRQKVVLSVDVCMAFMVTLRDMGHTDIPNLNNIISLLDKAGKVASKPLQDKQVKYLHKVVNRDYPVVKEGMTGLQYFAMTLHILINGLLIFVPSRDDDKIAYKCMHLAKGALLTKIEDIDDTDLELGAVSADMFIDKLKLAV